MRLSVIIPALNESQYISDTIEGVRQNAVIRQPHEIIVVDTGSTDGTTEIVKKLDVKLIEIKPEIPGRTQALNTGAGISTGDVYLFLDADTILPQGYDAAISTVLENPGIVGGAFEFSLGGKEFGLRVVELINRIRYRISHRFYGDQGIFVRAGVFREVGGYPIKRILEASYFCSSMKKAGKLALVRKKIKTSPRRFLEGGIYRVLASDIRIWWLDLIGISADGFADTYWKKNSYKSENCSSEK